MPPPTIADSLKNTHETRVLHAWWTLYRRIYRLYYYTILYEYDVLVLSKREERSDRTPPPHGNRQPTARRVLMRTVLLSFFFLSTCCYDRASRCLRKETIRTSSTPSIPQNATPRSRTWILIYFGLPGGLRYMSTQQTVLLYTVFPSLPPSLPPGLLLSFFRRGFCSWSCVLCVCGFPLVVRFSFCRAGAGKGGGLEGAAEACLSLGIPFVVVVRPHTLVAKKAVKVGGGFRRCTRLFHLASVIGGLDLASHPFRVETKEANCDVRHLAFGALGYCVALHWSARLPEKKNKTKTTTAVCCCFSSH